MPGPPTESPQGHKSQTAVTENIQGRHTYPLCKGPGAGAKLSGGHCARRWCFCPDPELATSRTLRIFIFQSSLRIT